MKNQQWRSEWQNGSGMPARRQMATEKTVTTTRAQHHGGHPTGPVLEASRGILPGWPMSMSLAHSSGHQVPEMTLRWGVWKTGNMSGERQAHVRMTGQICIEMRRDSQHLTFHSSIFA